MCSGMQYFVITFSISASPISSDLADVYVLLLGSLLPHLLYILCICDLCMI